MPTFREQLPRRLQHGITRIRSAQEAPGAIMGLWNGVSTSLDGDEADMPVRGAPILLVRRDAGYRLQSLGLRSGKTQAMGEPLRAFLRREHGAPVSETEERD